MIRYPVDWNKLEAMVKARLPTWLNRAKIRTRTLVVSKSYAEKSSIWSEVKPIFMQLQANKCVFCERRLEGLDATTIEHDLEHFRPKSDVGIWPPRDGNLSPYVLFTGAAAPAGYYWLAYELQNYAVSCKTCNTTYKDSAFPISGKRGAPTASITQLNIQESPYLCYPLGDADEDPRNIITFNGLVPVPIAPTGRLNARARVIIDFFNLAGREELRIGRAETISQLAKHLAEQADSGLTEGKRRRAADRAEAMQLPGSPHSRCAEAFAELWDRDLAGAHAIADACEDYLESIRRRSVIP